MSADERRETSLFIAGSEATYRGAFFFLAHAGDDINQLPCRERIIFGKAKVKEGGNCFFVTTQKLFAYNETKLPVCLYIGKKSKLAVGLKELISQDATVYWHGLMPADVNQGHFVIRVQDDAMYEGSIVKQGHAVP